MIRMAEAGRPLVVSCVLIIILSIFALESGYFNVPFRACSSSLEWCVKNMNFARLTNSSV